MKVLSEYLDFLAEVAMNHNEILKPNSSTGEMRYDILAKRISSERGKIELIDGRSVIIDPVKSLPAVKILRSGNPQQITAAFQGAGRAAVKFIAINGEIIPLSKMKKAAYFGGATGGSGGGAAQTTAAESAQAVGCAVGALNRGVLSVEDLTPGNVNAAKSRYRIDTTAKTVNDLLKDPLWAASTTNCANALFQSFPESRGMIFHRGSPWVKALEKVFNQVNNAEGKYFSNINKWNPADIWCVDSSNPLPGKEINSLALLNAWVQEQFEAGMVYGVSLKKAPRSASAKRVNYHGDADELLNLSIKNLLSSQTNNLFGSKDSYIVFEGQSFLGGGNFLQSLYEKEGKVQFRSFNKDAPIQGEISGASGASARHGKVGHGTINSVLKKYKMKPVTSKDQIVAHYGKDRNGIVKQLIANAEAVNPGIGKAALDKFQEIVSEMTTNMLISKYQAVETIANVKRGSKAQQNAFIRELVGYASSQSSMSSVFIKIS